MIGKTFLLVEVDRTGAMGSRVRADVAEITAEAFKAAAGFTRPGEWAMGLGQSQGTAVAVGVEEALR